MALNSSTVSAGDLATAQQYNDLRSDVVGTASGHIHDGTCGRGDSQFILAVAGAPLLLQNTTDAASNEVLRLGGGNRGTPADNDELIIAAYLDNCAGTQTEFGRITHAALDVTNSTKDSQWQFQQYTANTSREVVMPAITADDTIVVACFAQTLASKTLTTPTISSTGWANANHAHAASNSGGTLNASAIGAGTLAHERGGIEADISAITTGGILRGSSCGTMAVLASFLTSGGIVRHEYGGVEVDISAITTGGLLRGASCGVMSILAAGSNCQVLTLCSGNVAWKNAGAGVSLSGSTNNTVATVTGSNALAGEANLLFDGSLLFLNDCSNSNMTIGLTINQGANDNQALAFKSSDVSHPMTAHVEADTWFAIRRGSDPAGGAFIEGFRDADAEPGHALMLEGSLGEAANTVDSSASRGVVEIDARVTNGSTSRAAVGSTGNVLVVSTNDTALQVVKGNGDHHVTNTTLTALDDWPDALMGRVGRVAFSPECSPLRKEQGHLIEQHPNLVEKMHEERILIHEPCDPGPGFINVQKAIALAWDMGYQNYLTQEALAERITTLERHQLQDKPSQE